MMNMKAGLLEEDGASIVTDAICVSFCSHEKRLFLFHSKYIKNASLLTHRHPVCFNHCTTNFVAILRKVRAGLFRQLQYCSGAPLVENERGNDNIHQSLPIRTSEPVRVRVTAFYAAGDGNRLPHLILFDEN